MLTPLRSVFTVSLPFQPQRQSMAASFHGSANIRCVSSPSGGLSSRRAYLPFAALFGFHGRSNIYYFIISDSSSTVLVLLTVESCLRGVRGKGKKKRNPRTPALKSPPAGACHRPPPIRFPLLLWMCKCVSRSCLTLFEQGGTYKRDPVLIFCSPLDFRKKKEPHRTSMRVDHVQL